MSTSRDIADSATTINFIDGVTSNVQTQLDTATTAIAANTTAIGNISVTNGSQTKTYANNETSTIALSAAITSGAPVVSVTKEIPQTGLTNNNWDVDSDGANYDFENSAYSTTLTPSEASADGVFTLGSGSFDAADVGKIVSGNGGTAVIIKTDGSYNLLTSFTNTSAIASGSWTLKELVVDSDATGIALSSGTDEEGGVVYALNNSVYTGASFSVASQATSPSAMALSADGTKMYVLGENTRSVFQYTLSTAFDLSTASYASKSLSVSSQENNPKGLGLSNDGTKLYVCGSAQDTVFQYTLSTAFDVSTGSYASLSFSIASQESAPTGIRFNTDGTKMYVSGYGSGGDIFQYSLSTAFNVSTASYDSKSLNTNSQESYLRGFSFNSTGTQLFAIGGNQYVYQYYLTTAFDLSTASYSGASFSVAGQEGNSSDITFNTDGSKLYIVGETSDAAYEYSLDPRFNVKAADYMGNSFSVASQDTVPQGVTFNSDGSKMYVIGQTSDAVFQYTLSTAFAVSTASYDSVSFSVSSQSATPKGVLFNTNGTKMYVLDYNVSSVFQYSLSTAFDLSTASYDSVSFSASSQATQTTGFVFNNDGTKMYIVESDTNDVIYQYTLSTGFDLSTASYASLSFNVASQATNPREVRFNADGTQMFVLDLSNAAVFQYSLSTAFNVSTASYTGASFSVASQDTSTAALAFNTDGSKMYFVGYGNDTVYEYEMGGAFSLKTVEYSGDSFSVASQETVPLGLAFNNDGTKMYVVGYNSRSVYQYTLSTAFDVSTASYDSVSFSFSSQETVPEGLAFNNNGTKMYVVGTGSGKVHQYSLSTAFNVSTASYDSVSFSFSSQDSTPNDLAFNNNGSKMYMIGYASDSVYQYSLSTAFNVSTVSYDSVSFSVASQEGNPRAVVFNNNGSKMYVVGQTSDAVFQYTLSTGFDLSTASYDSVSFSIASQESSPRSVDLNTDGTKMYIVGTSNDSVYQYNVGSTLVQIPVVYSSDYAVAVTNSGGQINTTYWADINSTTATEVVGTGEVYYAYSTDNHVTWKVIHNTNGQRSIARNNSGTWQYNSNATYGSETWANATTNTEFAALRQAFSVAANRMDGTQMDAVADANHLTLASSLDFMIALKNANSTSTSPTSDGVALNYDANVLNQGAVLGTDYNWDFPTSTSVRLTSLGAYNLKVRIV